MSEFVRALNTGASRGWRGGIAMSCAWLFTNPCTRPRLAPLRSTRPWKLPAAFPRTKRRNSSTEFEIAFDGVENSVDELRRFVRGKAAGNFQGLVDRNGARRGLVQEFVNSQAQDLAIDQRHPRDAPVFSARTNSLIDLLQIGQRT